jgi:hypothetical protein
VVGVAFWTGAGVALGWTITVEVEAGVAVLAGVKVGVVVGVKVDVGAGEGVWVEVNRGVGVVKVGSELTAVPSAIAVKPCPLAIAEQPRLRLINRPSSNWEKYFIMT